MRAVPLWGVFVSAVVIILGSMRCGFGLGRRRALPDREQEGPVGTVAGAALGLSAFLLAFTFGLAADRFLGRKELLIEEVKAIGTAYARAELVAEPHRSEIRRLLREHIAARLAVSGDLGRLAEMLDRTHAIERELWGHAVVLARADMNSDVGALVVESLNQVFELHEERFAVSLQYRIPAAVWLVFAIVAILSTGMVGYLFGLSGRRSGLLELALAVTFAVVVWLNVDLDRPHEGALSVSQRPMLDLQQRMESGAP